MDVSNEKYESFDPHYTVEISRRMRVPERLSIGPNNGPLVVPQNTLAQGVSVVNGTDTTKKMLHEMAVPEKIVVGGFYQHLALKPEPRPLSDILTVATSSASGAAGLALGDSSQQANFVALPTPPRTLTVDTYLERTAQAQQTDDEEHAGRSYSKSVSEAETPPGTGGRSMRRTDSQLSPAALSGCEDDDTKLRRQMVRLARRVDWLEEENRRRSNRDLFYGTLVFGYIIYKVVTWVAKLPR